ncbi:hypothetical protein ACFL3G_09595 [Planctomycetota bacterium]
MRKSKKINLCSGCGFTLVEVLIATIFVGIAIVALLGANMSYTKVNGVSVELSTAEFLLEQIRERVIMTDYSGLSGFDDADYSPPIDALGNSLNDFAAFSQSVIVENVSDSDFEQVVGDGGSSFIRVSVAVSLNSREISSASWIRAQY